MSTEDNVEDPAEAPIDTFRASVVVHPQAIPYQMNVAGTSVEEDVELVYYKSNGTKYLYIFNHDTFTNHIGLSRRHGSVQDVRRMETVFLNLGYEVVVYNNLIFADIFNEISAISQRDHTETSCLCFAFLTFGENESLYASDVTYRFDQVAYSPFGNGHPSLVGIPKIYFLEGCKGSISYNSNILWTGPDGTLQLDGGRARISVARNADFMIYNSSVEALSFRRVDTGSFMIQELCNVIERYHAELDIQAILTLVNRRLAYYTAAHVPFDRRLNYKKQMPEVRHTLTKYFKF